MKRHVNSSLTVLVCLMFSAAPLVGCKKKTEEPEPEPTTGAEMPEPEPEPEVEPVEEPCSFQTVYFAFDSSELDPTSAFFSRVHVIRGAPRSTTSRSASAARNRCAGT